MKKRTIFQTSFVLLVLCIIFAGGDVQAVDQQQVFLPVTFRDHCSDFVDDFSNPASGWYIWEDEDARWEYLDGEYRILSKNDYYDFYWAGPPTCARKNYAVEVDARWVGEPGSSYGITFGVIGDLDQYYIWDVNTDFQEYRLWRFDGNEYHTIIPITHSNEINSGTASNHLKVIRFDNQIRLEVNGIELRTLTDNNITGPTFTVIHSSPYKGFPSSDARFDNFSVETLTHNPIPAICPNFFDDFNDPASGWDVWENEDVSLEYLDGEYRILSKKVHYENPSFNYAYAPTCARENYIIEVDVRWEDPDDTFGILFGIIGDLDQFYAFFVDPISQVFGLYRIYGSGYQIIVPITFSTSINGGPYSSNHLKVTRDEDEITLEINDVELGTWTDNNIIGETSMGIFSTPFMGAGDPTSDARFDNFSVTNLQNYNVTEMELGETMNLETNSYKVIKRHSNSPRFDITRSPPP